MIKNLLNADEEPPEGTKVIIEDSVINPPPASASESSGVEQAPPNPETRSTFEIPEDANFFAKPSETASLDEDSESLNTLMADIENLDDKDLDRLEKKLATGHVNETAAPPVQEPNREQIETEKPPPVAFVSDEKPDNLPSGSLFQSDYTPPSTGETIRQSGLAYSAAIVLFGSVVFMMILGWFADLLLGSSPWGIVGGIFLGGIIGIIQLFRITSQIFKK
ncbi:MAG TPA: hypothetical protein VGC97_14330 [Pyrinomonadaceae bacterium]|jgi:F0F1-type ATP synthase assembly protein I